MPDSITIEELRELCTPNMKELLHCVDDLLAEAYRRGESGEPKFTSLKERTAATCPDEATVFEIVAVVDNMLADAWERGRSGEMPSLIF